MSNILLVGNGGYATIQAAIDASADGDEILIASGTYTEALSIAGKAITLQAAGAGVIVQAPASSNAITLTGNFELGNVSILGIEVRGVAALPNQGIGVYVTEGANIGTLTLDGVTVQDAGAYGVFLDGEDSLPLPVAANVVITNSSFAHNGYNGANGAAHIKLFGFPGNALIQNVTITGAPEGTPVAQRPDYGIELTGTPNSFLSGGTTVPMGTVTLDNITMTGWLHKNGLAIYNYADLDGLTVGGAGAGHDVDLSGLVSEWVQVLNIDGILGDVDASGFNVVLPAATVSTELQGNTAGQPSTDQTITGTSANDRLMGKGGADHLIGGAGDDELYGHDKPGGSGVGDASNDLLEGGAGNDKLDGGAGTDTAHYGAVLSAGAITAVADVDPQTAGNQAGWQVNAGAGEGTDTLANVEIVDDGAAGRTLLVGSGGFATIQAAIDAATAGDTVLIAAGIHNENLVIGAGKDGLTIVGQSGAVLEGTFRQINGLAPGGSVADFLKTSTTNFVTGAGAGISVSADNVTIRTLEVRSFQTGIEFGNGTDHLRIENVVIDGTVNGVRKGSGAAVSGFDFVGGEIRDSYIGMFIAKETASGQDLNDLLISGTVFTKLVEKGLYFETLSNALITGITMTNVGEWGRGSAPVFHGGATQNIGGFGSGIDINLKWDHETSGDTVEDDAPYSNIVIQNFAFTDVGSSDKDGTGSPHFGGAAIAVKARDDAPSYSGPESASFSGAVIIQNGSIDGTSVGIRAGEPNKAVGLDNATGPAVNVSGVTVNNALVADVDDSSQSAVTVAMDADDTVLTAQDTARSTGSVNVTGTAGTDHITTAKGNDSITGGAGGDVIDGGAGTDTAHYTGAVMATANGATWSINAGDGEGTDTLANVEIVDDSAAGRTLLVGSGGFATIQAAIDASADGDKILIAAGTYTEALSIAGKAITLQAAGAGVVVQAPTSSNAITLTGNFELGNVSILGIEVRGVAALPNQGIGVYVTEGANIGTLTLDGVTVQDAGAYGVFLDGEDSLPLPVAANVVITNSSFAHNGYNGANGAAHIKLFGFPGNALIQNVTITGAPEGTPVAQRPDYGIELTGTPNSFLSGGTTVPMGTVTLDNITMTGWLHKNGLAIYNYADLDGLTVGGAGAGHDVDLSGLVSEWVQVLNIDGILGDVDASGFNVVLPAATVSTELQGNTAGQPSTDQTITGTSANDRLMGKGGADHLIGGAGDDELYGHDKPGGSGVGDTGNDLLEGGAGNDKLDGGGGIDTAQYAGAVALTANGTGWIVAAGVSEGADTLTNVEIVDDSAAGRTLLVGSGGFATIQAAIDAATAGDTVLIAAGTYVGNVTLKSGVNVRGVGASESAVVIEGTLSTPATYSNATVSMLTVHNASTSSMLLNMKGTSAITDVAFDHVTFSLTGGSFTGDVPIGNGQVSGSILLTDTNGDGAGLTFRHVTAASNNAAFEASTAFVFTLVHGARMVLDDVTLTGTASGSAAGLGAQWNMTPNAGETASVSIINSHTSGGGNFYVSGMDGVTITNNVFDGQGLALNGVTGATVTGNTFQNIGTGLTANGTQHRGLTIENAWGTDGVTDVTVTGNIFTNITAADGAIAFQRWTDAGGNPVSASTALLNDVDIHGNTFTTVAQALLFSGSSFSAATIAALANQQQLVIGTVAGDTIIDQAGASAMIGGTGSDTFVYSPGGGATIVADFAPGSDKVDLTHIPGVFFLADVLSKATQTGANVVIDFGGGDTLTLADVLKTNLASGDFVLAAIPVLTVQLLHDTGTSAVDKITSDATLTGTGDANTVVSFKIDGTPILATVQSNASGAWSFTAANLSDGTHTIEASQTNGIGNTGTITLTITLDRTIATPTAALAQDTGSSSSDKITSDASLTISAAAADVTRTYSVDGGAASGTYDAPTADGSHTVLVTDTDTAGNVATASITFMLDTTIATPTVALANDTGSSSGDKITSDTSLTISAAAADITRTFAVDGGVASGTYAAPTADGSHTVLVTDTDTAGNVATASITFTLDKTIATPTVALANDTGSSNSDKVTNDPSLAVSAAAGDVTRTFAVDGGVASGTYAAPTADGSHTVLVTDTDAAGNVATASITFTLDKTVAEPTVALANDAGSSNSDKVTNDPSLAAGAAAADVTRTYSVDGGAASGTYAAPTADGSHTVLVTDTDTAGNIATANITFTLDKTVATPTAALANDTGNSNSDKITNDASLTFSAVAADVTRTYSVDGGAASGTYAAPTADGGHTVLVTDTDTAGNVATASITFTLDKTVATPTAALANDTGSSNSDKLTNDASLAVSAAAADVTRTFTVDGGAASGTYAAPTADGNHTVLVTDTDTAGNVATASITFTLDVTAPAVVVEQLLHDTGTSATDKITKDGTVSGTGTPDTVVSFKIDGATSGATVTTDGSGAWSFTPTGLADGKHTLEASQTDAAGNTGTGTLTFTLDTTAPLVAITSPGGTTNKAALTISGKAEAALAGSTVHVFEGATELASATVGGDGTWTADVTLDGEGSHTIVASLTDVSGNAGASATVAYTLDTAAPEVAGQLKHDTGSSADDKITSDATLTGSGDPDTKVSFKIDGVEVAGTAQSDGTGAWSFTPTGLADGKHTVEASQTNKSGNTGTVLLTFTLDTAAPAVAVASTGGTTNKAAQAISGTVDAALVGQTVHVFDGATELASATVGSDGSWTANVTLSGEGDHTITANIADVAGNIGTSAGVTYALDTVAPVVTAQLVKDTGTSAADQVTSDAALKGTGAADTVVSFKIDGVAVAGTAQADSGGAWSFTPTGLADGKHTIEASQADAAGNTGTVSLTFTLDTTAPVVAVTSTGGATNKAAQTISGTVDASLAGQTVHVFDGASELASATVGAGGAWTVNVTLAGEGDHAITAKVSDAAGNTGTGAGVTYTLDTVAPVVTVQLVKDSGTSAIDKITNDASVTGTGTPDTVVSIKIDGAVAGTAQADGSGGWSFTPSGLADGAHTIEASQTDGAGNTGTASMTVTLDTTAPVVGITSAGGPTGKAAQTIAGTVDAALAGSTVHVFDGASELASATVGGDGAWVANVTLTGEGDHTIAAKVTDAAGNTGTSADVVYALDTVAPLVTGQLLNDTGASSADKVTNDATLKGTGAPDTVVSFKIDGVAIAGTAQADASGAWSFTPSGLADGTHTIEASQTDGAGNTGTVSLTVMLDTTAPAVAITSAGGPTSKAAQTIAGTTDVALAGQTVHVFDGASELASATIGGDGSWTADVTLTGEGNHAITAKIADAAGNTGTSADVIYALHTAAPVVTQQLLHDTGASSSDKVTSDATLSGTGAPDTAVTFTVDGVPIAGTAMADGSGAWSFTPTGLTDGSHTIVATQTDGLGGTGSASLTFTLDTTAPVVSITSSGLLTNKAAQIVSGTTDAALAGQTVHVFDGASELASATVGGDGSWSATVTMAGQGAHTISARVSDFAGNTGSSAVVLFTLDTIAPAVSLQLLNDTGPSPIDKITSDATVTGLGDANALVTFKIDGVAVAQTATADSSGAWSFTPLGLADGTHTIVASQTDGATNVGSGTLTFALDTSIPSVASILSTSASQSEGDTGATLFTFVVQLDRTQSTNQTMNWSVAGSGTKAADAADFFGGVLPSGTVVIAAGQSSTFVTVMIQGDKATEVNEQFTVTLSDPSLGVTIASASATSTIENDDNSLVDGYIAGATVFVDANGNGKLDAGEASTTTDANGNFTTLKGSGPLVAFGGVDMSTGLAFVGSLSAPTGSSVITPVTTLITALQASGIADLAEAQQVASKILGLDPGVDTLNIDPIAAAVAGNEAAAAAIVAGAKLLDTAQLIVSAVGDGGDKAAAFSTVFGAMAAAIGNLQSGEQYNLSDTATLTTLVNDVATVQGTDVSAIADDLVTIIAASNASLDQKLEENSSGLALFTDISAVARVALGETANDLQAAAGDPTQIAEAVANHTGDSLTDAIAVAAVEVAPATVVVSVEPGAQAEGDSGTRTYTFTLTLDHESISAQTLVWSVAGVGANAATASDFAGGVLPGGIVTFAAGETSRIIEVGVTGDTTVEPDETFALTLSEPSLGLIIGTASTTATIKNDDTSVAVVAVAPTHAEGTGASTAFTFTVTRSGDISVAHSVSYAVTGAGANPADASDLSGGALPSGVVSFAIGETTKTITIDVVGDASVESDEGFAVTLSNPSAKLTIGTASATAVIGNDDATVSIAALSAVAAEGNAGVTEFTFTVTRSGDISASASVAYAVTGSGAHAAAASDFVGGALPAGIVTFAVGETAKTVTVSVVGDVVVESDEDFTVSLSAPSAGLALGTAAATARMVNDDTSVSIAALLASKVEGNSGSTAFTFTVTRSGDTSGVSTAAYAVAGTGATQADLADFVGGVLPSGVVTFVAGETTRTITVNVAGDGTVEPDNGFVVTLSAPSAGTTIGTASAAGSILNDDLKSYDDAYVVLQGHTLTVSASAGVLANDDTAPPATATVQNTTTHGQLQLAADGAVTYNANAGFAGIDNFTYHAGSANGAADDAHALVYVVPVQVGPTTTTLNLIALSAEEQIAATYVAFFGRGADADGFEFWVDQFHGAQPTQGPAALFANIASSFGISAEAKALYPFLADPFHAGDAQIGAFLNTVYDNLFNRAPDTAGLNYWVNQIKTTLAAGKFVGTVLVDIVSGAQNTGDGQDITTVMGKVAVGLEFVRQQQEHDMVWAGTADIAAARALLDPVTSDAQSILTGIRNADTIVEHHA